MDTLRATRNAKFLLNYHFVWIPKYRRSLLSKKQVINIIEETINKLAKVHDFEILALEIMPDHIHLFISAPPRYSPSQIMNIIKGETGKEIAKYHSELKSKGSIWTRAYFVSSAGSVSSETIKKYIDSQWR